MATLASIQAWDDVADVVVLGSGLSGCVSAIEAFDTDTSLDVLIVEKMPEDLQGGTSRCSAGFLYCPRPDQLEDLLEYQRALNEPNPIPGEVLRTWGEAVVTQRPWIEAMAEAVGEKFGFLHKRAADFRDFPGASSVEDVYTIAGPSGVWRTFRANVDRRGTRLIFGTRATDLVQDGDTLEIFGVIAQRDGQQVAIRAKRAVIMCMGSLEANIELQRNYAGYPVMYYAGCPGNTGDGILMLQKAGAALWHLRSTGQIGGIYPTIKTPEFPSVFHRGFLTASSYIEIGKDNRRYYDETADYAATHYKLLVHDTWVDSPLPWVLPAHMIFDEATRMGGRFGGGRGWNMDAHGYEWSADNSAEIEKGWIVRAESLTELASKIGRDPEAVEAAVSGWNEACARGRDDEFGRDPERMQTIDGPPFFAVELVPGITGASAGGKRDEFARVLAQDGSPIPRLYEAGELGSTMANLYQSGSFLTEGIAFGRIAGRNAAREQVVALPESPHP